MYWVHGVIIVHLSTRHKTSKAIQRHALMIDDEEELVVFCVYSSGQFEHKLPGHFEGCTNQREWPWENEWLADACYRIKLESHAWKGLRWDFSSSVRKNYWLLKKWIRKLNTYHPKGRVWSEHVFTINYHNRDIIASDFTECFVDLRLHIFDRREEDTPVGFNIQELMTLGRHP